MAMDLPPLFVQNRYHPLPMNLKRILFFLLFPLFCMQCVPYQEEKLEEIRLDLNDPKLQNIIGLQERQLTDSLLLFFKDKDPSYRYAAVTAFGSIRGEKSKAVIDSIALLLQDDITGVRLGAAYALGQIGDNSTEQKLIAAFRDTTNNSNYVRKTILEAIGKSASARYLPALSTTKTYLRTDTLLLEGQSYGIYRYALRDIVSQEGTDRMASFLTKRNYPASVRLIAANYLQRAKNISVDSFALDLAKELKSEDDPNIRMALAIGLGKSTKVEVRDALLRQYGVEKDYRVKCNIIRALSNFDYPTVSSLVIAALDDPNIHIANTAAQFLLNHGVPDAATQYWRKAKDDTTLHWQTRLGLYSAANKLLPYYFEVTKGRINQELKNIYAQSENPYEKAEALKSLAEFGWNYRFIKEQGFSTTSSIIRTSTILALAKIAGAKEFNRFFGLGSRKVKTEIAEYLKEAVLTGDVGMIAEAAAILKDSTANFKSVVTDFAYLKEAQGKLKLPKEIEIYNALQKAIDYFNGSQNSVDRKPEFNHPVDWRIVNETTASTRAIIHVEGKEISIEFFPDAAPATVANFIQLARSGFYDGKNFHRVVDNFVVQGGCTRGDGYGSLNYSIRSELPQMYYNDEGFVGMASSGLHTECTQFFITHSPTPHLDGNYTIFAKVDEGMEYVHELEVGDVISKITITN